MAQCGLSAGEESPDCVLVNLSNRRQESMSGGLTPFVSNRGIEEHHIVDSLL